ncbi:MAG TPA: hypothetical protein VFN30_11925 [Chitinophagaceae bacterium]|nr:hypothetical protein [Chitinophagaceae bacterium]
MELNNLKEIWNDLGKEPVYGNNNKQLAEMLNKSSKSPIAKMKRNLLWEFIIVTILFIPVAIYYFLAFNGSFSIIAWMYILLLLLCATYFYYKNKLLTEMQCTACMVKSNLEKQVTMLERYVRLYLIAGTIIVPLVIIWLWFVVFSKLPPHQNRFHFFPSSSVPLIKTGVFWAIAIVVFTILLYYVNKWYIYKLYGRHIAKLKAILAEMEEE